MKAEIERASQALENMRRPPGRHLAALQEEVGDGTMFKGVSLTRNNTDDRFEQSKAAIINDAKQFLASRFEDFSSPVLKACCVISNNRSWPKDKNDLGLYGEECHITSYHALPSDLWEKTWYRTRHFDFAHVVM